MPQDVDFSGFALQSIVNKLNDFDLTKQEKELPEVARTGIQYARFLCLMDRLSVLIDMLKMVDDQTDTVEALEEFSDECSNRLFIMSVTNKLAFDDLIEDLKKFAVHRLPSVEIQEK